MRTALIGHTGFVGSNVASRHPFDDLYNTSNISDIRHREYDLVVSAGNRADSHRINKHPEQDRDEIEGLIDLVGQASIGKLVLISTVCVYPGGTSPDEDSAPSDENLTPYGRNRLYQEKAFGELFDTTVIRLPQLYGDGMKKGIIYDLAHDYRVEHIDPNGEFQYYDLRRLWGDIETLLEAGVSSFNAASPSLPNIRVAKAAFDIDISGNEGGSGQPPEYTRDMRTKHAALFGGANGYIQDAEEELAGIVAFAETIKKDR